MEYSELTTHQKYILRLLNKEHNVQLTGEDRKEANYLCSQKVLDSLSNMRYAMTELGKQLLETNLIERNKLSKVFM